MKHHTQSPALGHYHEIETTLIAATLLLSITSVQAALVESDWLNTGDALATLDTETGMTTSPGGYMMAKYNLAAVDQEPTALWQFYSGSGASAALMTHSSSTSSTSSTGRYELIKSPYTYMSYLANSSHLRGLPMNNGSVGVFLLAPTTGTYDISSSV